MVEMMEFNVLRKVQEISRLKTLGFGRVDLACLGNWEAGSHWWAALRVERSQENWFIFRGSVFRVQGLCIPSPKEKG